MVPTVFFPPSIPPLRKDNQNGLVKGQKLLLILSLQNLSLVEGQQALAERMLDSLRVENCFTQW